MGMEKLNSVIVIPHSESTIDEEVEFTTSTQYVISGSTLDISRVKGALQVREMSVSNIPAVGNSTAESKPAHHVDTTIKLSYKNSRMLFLFFTCKLDKVLN